MTGAEETSPRTRPVVPLLHNLDGAAAALGVSTRTIRRLTADGELPCVRIRSKILYPVATLGAYCESLRAARPTSPWRPPPAARNPRRPPGGWPLPENWPEPKSRGGVGLEGPGRSIFLGDRAQPVAPRRLTPVA